MTTHVIQDAHWEPIELAPETYSQFMRIWADPEVEILLHRSGQFAIRALAIGGGWDLAITRIERRDEGDRRLDSKDWDHPDHIGKRTGDRRTGMDSLTFEAFIDRHGNGEAE